METDTSTERALTNRNGINGIGSRRLARCGCARFVISRCRFFRAVFAVARYVLVLSLEQPLGREQLCSGTLSRAIIPDPWFNQYGKALCLKSTIGMT